LFIKVPPETFSLFYSTKCRFPLTVEKKKNENPHEQISSDQCERHPVVRDNPCRSLNEILPMSFNRQSVEVPLNVRGYFHSVTVPVSRPP
jgi:hypothetical protein